MNNPHPKRAPSTVRDATIALLRSLGMTTIFGNPGSTELPFFKQWPKDFRYILGLQEASVVAMADGYAQVTHNAAFVNLHSAVGLGHALGNIFTTSRNQTPLVITAGQQTRAMLPTEPYLFARDASEFPRPYVKWSYEPARAQDVPAAIARAYYLAMQKPCGPTFVSIPADDWESETEPVTPRQVSFEFAPDPVALQHLADALNHSTRPALIVGPSVDRDGARDAVVALAEQNRNFKIQRASVLTWSSRQESCHRHSIVTCAIWARVPSLGRSRTTNPSRCAWLRPLIPSSPGLTGNSHTMQRVRRMISCSAATLTQTSTIAACAIVSTQSSLKRRCRHPWEAHRGGG